MAPAAMMTTARIKTRSSPPHPLRWCPPGLLDTDEFLTFLEILFACCLLPHCVDRFML